MSIHLYVNDVPDEVIEDSVEETSPTSTDKSVNTLAKASLDQSSRKAISRSQSSEKLMDSSGNSDLSKTSHPKDKKYKYGLGTGYYDVIAFTPKEVEHYKKHGPGAKVLKS